MNVNGMSCRPCCWKHNQMIHQCRLQCTHPEECGCHRLCALSAGVNGMVHQVLDAVVLYFLHKTTSLLYNTIITNLACRSHRLHYMY